MRRSILASLIFVAAVAAALAQARAASTAEPPVTAKLGAARQAFIAAMARVRLNQSDSADPPALQDYVIRDYLVAARLRRDVSQSPGEDLDARVDAFLAPRAGLPVTRALRRDWLLSLAQRRLWSRFLARSADAVDATLICDRLAGRLATGDTDELAAAALLRWLQPQRPPPECNDVFAWLRQQNLLTPALAEQRARAALSADNPRLARESAADALLQRQSALLQWAYLLESPKAALTVLATHPTLPAEPDALAAGFDKLTHGDSGSAWTLLPALVARPEITPELKARLARSAALGLSYDRDPRALAAFAELPPAAVDAQVQEWRVRAALWLGDFVKARQWIETMPPSLASQPRWRYWRARSLEATAGGAQAGPLYADLAELRDYYGYLAADRTRRGYQLHAKPSLDDPEAQSLLAEKAGVVRARELFECDQTDDAMTEWSAALGAAQPAAKVQAAHLAARWGWYNEAIVTLAQAGEWDDVRLRYPRPYAEAVADGARLAGIPPDWILAVMRQESLFRKDAVSRADARGVMQMMLPTAAQVARRWHLAPPGKDGLFDPRIAIPLGAVHLRELLDKHGNHLAVTLASYNAGSNAVARWMPERTVDADVWIENIPFNETRAYVQHVLEHVVAFAFVRDAEPPRLESLLAAVAPGM